MLPILRSGRIVVPHQELALVVATIVSVILVASLPLRVVIVLSLIVVDIVIVLPASHVVVIVVVSMIAMARGPTLSVVLEVALSPGSRIVVCPVARHSGGIAARRQVSLIAQDAFGWLRSRVVDTAMVRVRHGS